MGYVQGNQKDQKKKTVVPQNLQHEKFSFLFSFLSTTVANAYDTGAGTCSANENGVAEATALLMPNRTLAPGEGNYTVTTSTLYYTQGVPLTITLT